MEEKDTAEAREPPLLHDDLCLTRLLAGCLLKCSGHGHCDPITKRCICSQLWMENLIQRYIRDGESNCGESWRGGWLQERRLQTNHSELSERPAWLYSCKFNPFLTQSPLHQLMWWWVNIFPQFTLGVCLRFFLKTSCWGNSPRQSRCC